MRGSELVRATARVTCSVASAAIIASCAVSCAAVPAARQAARAERAIGAEQRRRLRDPAHASERTYQLTMASALLDKAREEAAKGRFQSARDLAAEAAQLAHAAADKHASAASPGGGA